MSYAVELRQKRGKIIDQARKIIRGSEKKGSLSRADEERWGSLMSEADSLQVSIDREERQSHADASLEARTAVLSMSSGIVEERGTNLRNPDDVRTDPAYTKAFSSFLRHGEAGMDMEMRYALRNGHYEGAETRALSVGVDAAGGYTVPDDFYRRVEKAMKAFGGMREAGATILPTSNGQDLPIPTSDDTGNTGVIVSENTAVGEQDATFSQRTLGAYMYTSKIVRVSIQLIQDNAVNLNQYLAEILAERIGRATNAHFTTGSGTGQPEGVLTAASAGAVGATGQTTSVTYDDLVDLEHSVDRAYRRRGAKWMLNDNTLKALKKLKDADGDPIWASGLSTRQPDTLLGYPYVVNNDMPDMAASAKSILFGDFSKYFIRDVLQLQLVRFGEKYMDQLQVGFQAYSRHDGLLVDAGQGPVRYYQNSAT